MIRSPQLVLGCSFLLVSAGQLSAQLQPAAPPEKPRSYAIPAGRDPLLLNLKLRDGLHVRLRDGALTDFGTGALAAATPILELLREGTWSRTHTLEEEQLDELRRTGERRVGFALHDLNLHFRCRVPAGFDLGYAIDRLNALDCVELAEAVPSWAPLPQIDDYREKQGYQEPAPRGIGAGLARSFPDLAGFGNRGASGLHARVAWIEYGFDPTHVDLPPVAVLTPPGWTDPNSDQHGTAVLGQLAARNDGFGTTGIAPEATYFFAHARSAPTPSAPYGDYIVDASIQQAAWAVGYRGVILLEQQISGPRWNGSSSSQFGLLPVEWHLPTWQSIRNAVAAGAIVVEAAGNGSQNLDELLYDSDPWAPHRPFRLANDSGALMVGAGAAPQGALPERARLAFSNFGATLDLQGWGEKVTTTGYGDLYSAGGPAQSYTQVFSGTSSASPIVAGTCALLHSIAFEAQSPHPLGPAEIRTVLRRTGTPQGGANPSAEKIGPLPNLIQALQELDLHPRDVFGQGFEGSLPNFGGNGIDLLSNGAIHALAVYDADGPGPEPAYLYAGGSFTRIGGLDARNIARWTGVGWARLGTRAVNGTNGPVHALHVHDADGVGGLLPHLYVGGEFTQAPNATRVGIARWNGTVWSSVGSGVGGATPHVYACTSFDEDGAGPLPPSLIVGGAFTSAGGNSALCVASWRKIGLSFVWSPLDDGFGDRVNALEVYDADLGGPQPAMLLAGGAFKTGGVSGTLRTLAVWSGLQWFEFAGGTNGPTDTIYALESVSIPLAGQQVLFVGGQFADLGGSWVSSPGFGAWNGSVWLNPGVNVVEPRAICAVDDCRVGLPYCAPSVFVAEGNGSQQLYRIDPTTWSGAPLAPLGTRALACALFDADGEATTPPVLYLGGHAFQSNATSAHGLAQWTPGTSNTSIGVHYWNPTGCGWPFEPTLGVPAPPVFGRAFRVNFELSSTASPLLLLGLPAPFALPLCPSSGACALNVHPILASYATRQLTLTIPCDALLLGAQLAFQGLELGGVDAPGACGAPQLPFALRTTSTLVLHL